MSNSSTSKIGRAVVVAVVAVGLGCLVGWFLTNRGDVTPVAVAPVVATNAAPVPLASLLPVPTTNVAATAGNPDLGKESDDTNAAPEEPKTLDQKLDEILLSSDDPDAKAAKILALMPNAPPDMQVELSQHLVNMVQDDNYAGTAEWLTNSSTPVAVSTVLMNDLLNRNNNLKLPMLLDIARNDNHPLRGQAKDMLELFIQADNGTNWDQWSASIDTWLKDNSQ